MHTCAWREPLGPIVSENMLRHASRSHAATMLSTRLRRGTALRQVVRRPNKVDCTWQQARNIVVHEAPAQAHRHGARNRNTSAFSAKRSAKCRSDAGQSWQEQGNMGRQRRPWTASVAMRCDATPDFESN